MSFPDIIKTRLNTNRNIDNDSHIIQLITVQRLGPESVAKHVGVTPNYVNDLCFNTVIRIFNNNERVELNMITAAELYEVDYETLRTKLIDEALRRHALPRTSSGHLCKSDVSKYFDIPPSSFVKLWLRHNENKPLFPKNGIIGPLSVLGTKKLENSYIDQGYLTSKDKVTETQLRTDTIIMMKKERKLSSFAPSPEISRFQLSRLQKQILPEITGNPVITNEKRVSALNNFLNAVTNATMLYAIIEPTEDKPKGRFLASNIYSMDAMTIQLGKPAKNRPVYAPRGCKVAMKKLGRSAARVSQNGERKTRNLKLMATCNSSPEMVSAIHIIKQRTCVKPELIPFGRVSGGVCEHYNFMLPARPRKAELKKILAAEKLLVDDDDLQNAMDLTDDFEEDQPEVAAPNPYDTDDEDLFDEDFTDDMPRLKDPDDSDDENNDDDEVKFKDARFPTDTELSRVMLKDVILKDAINLRRELKIMRSRVAESISS